jgi:hypothetical protein
VAHGLQHDRVAAHAQVVVAAPHRQDLLRVTAVRLRERPSKPGG